MKKYVKPDLYYENFELSAHVASCGIEIKHGTPETCKARGENYGFEGTIFAVTPNCDVEFEGYCYTNGGGSLSLFSS